MTRYQFRLFAFAFIGALALQACAPYLSPIGTNGADGIRAIVTTAGQPSRHLVLFWAELVPSDFADNVARLGGSVEASLDGIGMATVTGLSEAAAAELAAAAGVQSVTPDPIVRMADDVGETTTDVSPEPLARTALASAHATRHSKYPSVDSLYSRQWNMRAVSADEAWKAGHLGSRRVVVAIVDTGIDYLHPDLVGLVDLERSKSFVEEDFPGRLPISDLHGHGTAVASIVGSNGTVLAGINQHVTLLAVKTANKSFQTSAGQIICGIMYAADRGADVINVSRADTYDKNAQAGIVAAFARATKYAFRKGALVVSIADNDNINLDQFGDKVKLPCQSPHVICVSGTAPTSATGFLDSDKVNVDAPALYSGFGRSAVDVAAPSGTRPMSPPPPPNYGGIWTLCTTTPTELTPAPCRSGQLVVGRFGTSFAAPHVSGLAALLVAEMGHNNPALIRARILHSADDLGEPGTDPYYGKGRINVARALGLHHPGKHWHDGGDGER